MTVIMPRYSTLGAATAEHVFGVANGGPHFTMWEHDPLPLPESDSTFGMQTPTPRGELRQGKQIPSAPGHLARVGH